MCAWVSSLHIRSDTEASHVTNDSCSAAGLRPLSVLLSVHLVELVFLDVPVQRGVFGHPPHPRQDEGVGEVVSAQSAAALGCQNAVHKVQAEAEAVVVVFIKPATHREKSCRQISTPAGDGGDGGEGAVAAKHACVWRPPRVTSNLSDSEGGS